MGNDFDEHLAFEDMPDSERAEIISAWLGGKTLLMSTTGDSYRTVCGHELGEIDRGYYYAIKKWFNPIPGKLYLHTDTQSLALCVAEYPIMGGNKGFHMLYNGGKLGSFPQEGWENTFSPSPVREVSLDGFYAHHYTPRKEIS